MEQFSLMLDRFFSYCDTSAAMFGLAVVFMIIANSLSFLKYKGDTAHTLYVGIVLIAAMFSAFGLLLTDLSLIPILSVYAVMAFVIISIATALFTAFTKKKDYYAFASLIFYVCAVMSYVVLHV